MKPDLPLVALGIAASFVVSACGGSSGGRCSNSAACGGDIVGTWKITSSCVSANLAMLDGTCPAATLSTSDLKMAGSVTYNADLSYIETGTVSGTVVVTEPTSCFTSQGVTPTCDDLNQEFQSNNQDPALTLHCTGTTTCTCTETFTNEDTSQTGTYTTTTAGVLTETRDGESSPSETDDYCVKGTAFTLSPHADSMMMGQPIMGTITLTKS
jgi:hypothetical protein